MAPDPLCVELHQALFGYSDGHSLLASSARLPEQTISVLLPLSDLAPGVDASDFEGYWTGVPLTSTKQYALMHTWPAPEMPRPGCVWTHMLLVSFIDLGRFLDLHILVDKVARPRTDSGVSEYSNVLTVPVERGESDRPTVPVLGQDALRVLRALYGRRSDDLPDVPVKIAGAATDVAFAVWSQQWPELRCAFSFRTIASKSESTTRRMFSLQVDVSTDDRQAPPNAESWETAAVSDLIATDPTEFRRFLWRYGPDVRRGRERFRLLANLFRDARTTPRFNETLAIVAQALPDSDDGRTLKRDLVAWWHTSESQFVPNDPVVSLSFLVDHAGAKAFPSPSVHQYATLAADWQTHSGNILSLAERACVRDSHVREPLVEALAQIIGASEFFSATADKPNLRTALSAENPWLLDSPELETLGQPDLSTVLPFMPDNDKRLAAAVVGRLLRADDENVAVEMLRRFPDVTTRAVVETFNQPGQLQVAGAWLKALRKYPSWSLDSEFMTSAPGMRSLARLAQIIGHETPEVLSGGPLPWTKALVSSEDNLEGQERLEFLTFLMIIALAKPEPACEPLFELAFSPIHSALMHSQLPWDAFGILTRRLPSLGWRENWDTCKRLRLAVVRAYVGAGLDLQSFRRLSDDREVRDMLTRMAQTTSDGRKFLNQLTMQPGT